MHVFHIVSSLQIGGAERLVVDLACAQRRAGLAVSIVDLGADEQPLARSARRLGLDVIRVGRLRSRMARLFAIAHEIAGRARVVHLHNPRALRATLPILPLVRGPIVYTRHGASPYAARSWRAIHRLARRFIDRVTFVTDEARRAYEATHGASPGIVIANGVAIPPVIARHAPTGRLRLGSVGRLVELKGHLGVLEAVAALAPETRPSVELHLFGDGPERDRLETFANTKLRDAGVVFHGTVLDREHIYDSIDVLVVGSRTEGQSMAIMEAMARSVPVIATDVGGNRELVADTGVLVPAGDTAAIRDAVATMLADRAFVERCGRASRARIAARHSIDDVAAKYTAIYSSSS
jgi:glycosyltransferase involved in cell wall biosynthesis